jgi:TPR repeat protein
LLLSACEKNTTEASSDRGLGRQSEMTTFQQEPHIAILVGIDAYAPASGFRKLDYAKEDVKALGQRFTDFGYTVLPLVDVEAKKSFILKTIAKAGEQFQSGQGTLVFIFTGHGFSADDGGNYLAVDGTSDYDLEISGLKLDDVTAALKATGARRIMVFIDACRSSPFIGKSVSSPSFTQFSASEGMNILYSTAQNEVSIESSQLQHGVFTYFLLQGMEGKAAQDGVILFDGLADYVTQAVKEYSFKTPPHQIQKPYRAGESSGQFLIADLSGVKPPPCCTPPPIEPPHPEVTDNHAVGNAIASYRQGNFSAAEQQLRPLAEQQNGVAQFYLARLYLDGNGVTRNETEAQARFVKAAAQLPKAADTGDAEAQYALAWLYDNGKGMSASATAAVAWYRKAAEQNQMYAQDRLGVKYQRGEGVAQSSTEALVWFRKAAEQGYADGQLHLGWMYLRGNGVKKSYPDAEVWLRKAAEQGDRYAQNNLGWIYQFGKGVKQSDSEAFKWYSKSAAQGNPNGQYHLGWMYENGKGVEKSVKTAIDWYQKAVKDGQNDAKKRLAALKNR